jgi:tRNA A58 N-methylase Trm61
MTPASYLLIGVIGLGVLIYVGWRLSSQRHRLPCPPWLAWMVERDNPLTKTNRSQTIMDWLGLDPGMKVLDAGCGPGRLTVPAARSVGQEGEVMAVDVQERMLARARRKVEEAGLENVVFLQAALGEGKLPADRFDRAMLVTVLGEIPDKTAALKEIYGALKPGGILSVTEVILDPHFQSREAVLRVAGEVGFEERAFFGNKLAYTMHLGKAGSG